MRTFALVVLVIFVSAVGAVRPACGLDEGDVVPDFALIDIEGKEVHLYDYLAAGKIVILEHLNVYCHTCREAIPVMNEIHAKYAGEVFQMVGIGLNNSATEVREFRSRFDVQYYVLPDPEKSTLPLFTLENVPTLDVIDASGTLRYRHLGKFASLEEFDRAIARLRLGETIVGPEVGNVAPLFALPGLEGEKVSLENLRESHKVALAFFSDLSDKVIAQAKVLNKVQRRYEDEGVVALGVFKGVAPEVLSQFREAQEIQFSILLDADGAAAQDYRVKRFPHLWIINAAGKVRYEREVISLKTFDEIFRGKEVVSPCRPLSDDEKERWLKEAMPLAASFEPLSLGGEMFYEALRRDGSVIGLIRIACKDVLCDVCSDVHMIYTVDIKGRVVRLVMIEPVDSCYGKQPIDQFRQQILGHSIIDPLVLSENIHGISGSTNSTTEILGAINETEELVGGYKNPNFMVEIRKKRCFTHMRAVHEAVSKYNDEHPDAPMVALDLEKLGDYLPEGGNPTCALDGTYILTDFGGKEVILCTFHGVDVERYGITFE